MSKMLSAFVGLGLLGSVGMANAAQPVALTEAQMDSVTAGQVAVNGPYLSVTITGNLSSTEGLNADFTTATFFVVTQ